MARVTLNQQTQQARQTPQAQQMSQSLAAIQRSLQGISAGIGAATPAQREQISGALGSLGGALGGTQPAPRPAQVIPSSAAITIQPRDTLSQIAQRHGTTTAAMMTANPQITNPDLIIAGRTLNVPGRAQTPTPTPAAPAPATPQVPQVQIDPLTQWEDFRRRQDALLRSHEAALQARPQPEGLTEEERRLFTDERAQLSARYDSALESLRRQQEQDRGRLMGRYAAMGFSEPGAIAGPMAGEPGIVTAALQRTGEQQRREMTALEQARAGDTLAVARAQAEAERRAVAEEAQEFERRQTAMIRNLERQAELARPEEFTMGGRMFQRDNVTGEVIDITPPEALQRRIEMDRGGRRLEVTFDAEGREVGAIDLGPSPTQAAPADRRITPTQAINWDVPIGTTENQLAGYLESVNPPQWFINRKNNQHKTTLTAHRLRSLWAEWKKGFGEPAGTPQVRESTLRTPPVRPK